MTYKFYEGASSAAPFITTFTTLGNNNNYSTWSPRITFGINSGGSGQIDITIQDAGKRITIDGISVVAVPEPSAFALLGLGGLGMVLRRRR